MQRGLGVLYWILWVLLSLRRTNLYNIEARRLLLCCTRTARSLNIRYHKQNQSETTDQVSAFGVQLHCCQQKPPHKSHENPVQLLPKYFVLFPARNTLPRVCECVFRFLAELRSAAEANQWHV